MFTTLFSEQERFPVEDGIRKFIRLLSLPVEDWQLRFVADESDLKLSLDSIKRSFEDTRSMLGLKKYQGIAYDAPEQVKRWQETYLFSGRDDQEVARNATTYTTMYYLVMEPIIDLFRKFSHEQCLEYAPMIIDHLIEMVDTTDAYGTADDAIVAREQIRSIVRQREEARKVEVSLRKKNSRKKRDTLLEDIEDADITDLAFE